MSLRTRLLLAQLPLALSLLLVGAISRRTVSSLDNSSQAILKDNYLSVVAAQHMRDAADAMGRAVLTHARNERPSNTASDRATFERELRFQEGNITEVGEDDATARTRTAWTRYQATFDRLLAAPAATAADDYPGELEKTLVEIERSTTQIVTLNEDAMQRKSERARQHAERVSSALFAANALAFAVGLFASI
jgi:two-component system, NtrC family, sensor histidine kinase KinB